MSEWNKAWDKWNWSWPVSLVIGVAVGFKVFRDSWSGPFALKTGWAMALSLVYLGVLGGYCFFIGVSPEVLLGSKVLDTLGFQLVVSFFEEAFYRGIGLASLARVECSTLKASYPVRSLAFTSLLFGFGHGINSLLDVTGSFDFVWFLSASFSGLAFGLIFVRTQSVGLAGLSHFFVNTVGVLLLPAEKVRHSLSTLGFIDW